MSFYSVLTQVNTGRTGRVVTFEAVSDVSLQINELLLFHSAIEASQHNFENVIYVNIEKLLLSSILSTSIAEKKGLIIIEML